MRRNGKGKTIVLRDGSQLGITNGTKNTTVQDNSRVIIDFNNIKY